MTDDWDSWDSAPVVAEPPRVVPMPGAKGRGRGLLKMKVPGANLSPNKYNQPSRNDNQFDDWENNENVAPRSYGGRGGGYSDRGSGGQSRACHKCNEEGHFARECPNSGSGGQSSRACHKCNEEGHFARECPNADTRACHKCNKPGHFARECTEDTGFGFGGRGGQSGRACHKCNEEGHMARECPNSGGDTRTCRKCNQPGHIARDCPDDSSGGYGGGSRACHRCNEEGHIAKECPNSEGDTRTCHKCNQPGHIARDCPEAGDGVTDGPGPSTYIPDEYNDADDLVVKAGINFDRYDRIDVEVTGRDKPNFITSFKEANFHQSLSNNIPREFTKPTPVQKYSIPIIQKGRDLMACSQTGSGKTAAFLLPIIDYLLREEDAPALTNSITVFPRALILGPTRELVLQTYQWSEKLTKNTNINGRKLYGKIQTAFLKNHLRQDGGTHILSATPGRLKDFLEKGWISFNFLKFVVLDEADRMLDMGFAPDIAEIFGRMTSQDPRQVLMFSATFPKEVQKMAGEYCNDYLFLAVGIVGAACSDVDQQIILVESRDEDGNIKNKDDCLRDILVGVQDPNGRMKKKVLVFVEQKKKADCLGMELCEQNFSATTIHGDREQPEREEALRTFKRGKHMLLVATSVAARGLDIPEVDIVINYDIPSDIDSYVHRIGRTGRCGNKGQAISFYDPSSDSGLASVLVETLQKAGQPVPSFLEKDSGYAGGSRGTGHSRDIRRNVPRSRHNFGYGKPAEDDFGDTDDFMKDGQNFETEPSWGNSTGGGVAQEVDDGW